MSSKQDNELSFTPEYSSQLLRCIEGVYDEDIKHYYTHLKLEKLIDLLEHTEYLFESYTKFLHDRKDQDALTVFIIGCFYLYLIMPQSIQFQTRNKSYSIYNELKKMYENQVNMTNVLLMVKDEVDSILEGNARELNEVERRITRKRAYSVPDQHLAAHLTNLALTEQAPPLPDTSAGTVNDTGEESYSGKSWNSSYIEDNEDSPVWTAPSLEPNDQLKLALDTNVVYPSEFGDAPANVVDLVKVSTLKNNPKVSGRGRQGSMPIKQTVYPIYEDRSLGSKIEEHGPVVENNIWESNVDRLNTHRKDSYHSVYMFDEDLEADNPLHVSSNGYIDNLQRLQKQSIITAPELFSILSSPEQRYRLLLIDLRISKRSRVNHIVAPNTIKIDPKNLWDPPTKVPLSDPSALDNLIPDRIFTERSSFDYIVYYTDMKTYMNTGYDYLFTLFYLLTTSQNVTLKTSPTYLLGGWEKWKKVLNKYSSEYNINMDDYMYRPYGEAQNNHLASAHKQVPAPPSWNPPEVPMRIRKRPPPPPPISNPNTTNVPPPVPPKISIEQSVTPQVGETIADVAEALHVAKPASDTLHTRPDRHNISQERATKLERSFSIPTIEKSPNTYVALSITGLRNLGNTCYINSMLQCLFATPLFRDMFLSSKYENFFNPKFKNEPRLSKSFNDLFKKMYINGGCSVVPTAFLKNVNYLRPDMRIPDDQQDTQEFLMVVLDRLHDELSNQVEVAGEYPDLLLYDENKLEVKNDEYRNWFEKTVIGNGLSPIDHIFQGQMENVLDCQRCGNTSQSYSTFYILSLAIPKPSTSTFSRSKRVKLEDCINLFTSDEVLSGENAWDCPKCGSSINDHGHLESKKSKKKKWAELPNSGHSKSKFFSLNSKSSRSKSPFGRFTPKSTSENWKSKKLLTVKTMNFITLPPVLVIHLSRFYYDLTKKNNTIITYPLVLNIVPKNNQVVKYRLYAVVNHSGNLISGHYTSLVNKDPRHNLHKDGQKWYYFDDEVVKEERNHGNLDEGIIKVSSSDVYVIFYERINT